MKSNGTKTPARQMAFVGTFPGVLGWIVGFFAYFAFGQFRALHAFFAVLSIVMFVIYFKLLGMTNGTEGNPAKKSLYGSLVCYGLQILFFGAMAILGPAAIPGAGSFFFCFTAIYLICPVWVYSNVQKHGL